MTREERMRDALEAAKVQLEAYADVNCWHCQEPHFVAGKEMDDCGLNKARELVREALSAAPETPQAGSLTGSDIKELQRKCDEEFDKIVQKVATARAEYGEKVLDRMIARTQEFIAGSVQTEAPHVGDINAVEAGRIFQWVRCDKKMPPKGDVVVMHPPRDANILFFDGRVYRQYEGHWDEWEVGDDNEWLEELPPRVGDGVVSVEAVARIMAETQGDEPYRIHTGSGKPYWTFYAKEAKAAIIACGRAPKE